MIALSSTLFVLAGLALVSLGMQRHRQSRPRHWQGAGVTLALRIAGAVLIAVSAAVPLRANLQLGLVEWSGYAMIAGFAVTALHSYAERAVPWAGLASGVLAAGALALA
ncbi:MAG TPA: DUF3325 family protein [Xanthobacteraceae bacterium]|nr:DUF3325 family protein [Xanthobacteraceae bacterium]